MYFPQAGTGCQWQITSAFPWYTPVARKLHACNSSRLAVAKSTRLPCHCPCARMRHNHLCLIFSKNFNIVSALSVHQSLTLPQKIDSREGLFWCKKGWVVNAGKMNFYLKTPSLAPNFGLFAAKWSAFWCKTRCNLPLNAVRFGAKCNAFWC